MKLLTKESIEVGKAESQSQIAIKGVSKVFVTTTGDRLALHEVSLSVAKGQTVTVLGPSGCGKTTLLNLVAGFSLPSKGEILVGNRSVTGPSPDRGFMFQRPTLFPWMTVLDNIQFPCLYGKDVTPKLSKHEIKDAALFYLDKVGLRDARNLYPHQMSGGMQSRAALARLLIAQSSVLLMDEPFAALDAQTRLSMQRLLTRVVGQEGKRTIFFITHDVEEALLISDDIYLMSAAPGRILRHVSVPFAHSGDHREVVALPEFTALKYDLIDQLERLIPSH